MPARIGRTASRPTALVSDEELVGRAALVGFIDLEHPFHQGGSEWKFGDEPQIALRRALGAGP